MLDVAGRVDLLFLKCVFGRAIGLPVVRLDDVPGRAQLFPVQAETGAIKQRRIKHNLSGAPLFVYLMTGVEARKVRSKKEELKSESAKG